MKISIASGKGGTGKTTVAINMVLSLGNAELLDCDVEEPNCNVFLKKELTEKEDVTISIPDIDLKKCDFCGKCSEFCEYNALAVTKRNVMVFEELCHGCGGCKLVCPQNAIAYKERKIGEVSGDHEFHQGELNVGEAMATPVVAAVKEKIACETVIIDAPPGAACPVIEAVSGTDYCILVTEPTSFGLSDLSITVKLMKKLQIPHGVVINREGIGDKRVEKYCKKSDIPVLMKIPQDKRIAELYSRGIPFVQEMQEWKEKFKSLYEAIR
ncbi:MAG: ATP-binding protein [Euryarchaeota archaeon]|nr:ATP-binding protein [Euryarchaeota archaeon]